MYAYCAELLYLCLELCKWSHTSQGPMQITVTYKRVRRLSLRVTSRGEVHVSAPVGTLKSDVQRFIRENEEWILRAVARTEQRQDQRQQFYDRLPLTTRNERAEAQQRLDAIVQPLIARYEPLMGVRHSGITYKRLRSRWGSCNVRSHELTFSLYLLLLPDWCIEHVVVHELAHLLVPNHSPAFHHVMDRFFPRWREARAHVRSLMQ